MPKLRMPIDAKVFYQMYEYAAFAKAIRNSEIAGYGHFNEENGIYKLAPLTKQIVTGSDVDAFPSAIVNDVNYDISDMIVQWHSHVEMNTFFSGTDLRNIKDMLRMYPMLISIVVNVKHEYTARLDIRSIAYGNQRFRLPESDIMTYDLELIPYYMNDIVWDEVTTKLRRPRVKPQRKPKPTPTPADDKKNGNEQGGLFDKKELDDWWERGMWDSTYDELVELGSDHTGTVEADMSTWFKDIMMLAGSLCRNHNKDFRCTRIEQNGNIFISHEKTKTWCTINKDGVMLHGVKSTWKDFLIRCGSGYLANYSWNGSNLARARAEWSEFQTKKEVAGENKGMHLIKNN